MAFKAAIFDMDGVITNTAELHFYAWKMMFDAYLQQYTRAQEKTFFPFSRADYLNYVDGFPRYVGIKTFLNSRDIVIPMGIASDDEWQDSVYGLGCRKNKIFRKALQEKGVPIFASSVDLMQSLQKHKIHLAVVSSSRNCKEVLMRAQLLDYFDVRVDGSYLDTASLRGKPFPDMFLDAARKMSVLPAETAVFEDAVSGVEAAAAGHFGFVVGVDRFGDFGNKLLEKGAHKIIADLSEISYADLVACL